MQGPPPKRRREPWRPAYTGKTQPLAGASPSLPARPGPLARMRSADPALFELLELIGRLVLLLVLSFAGLTLIALRMARTTTLLLRDRSEATPVLVFAAVLVGTLCCCAHLWGRPWGQRLRFFGALALALAATQALCALLDRLHG